MALSRRYFFYGSLLAGAVPTAGFGSVASLKIVPMWPQGLTEIPKEDTIKHPNPSFSRPTGVAYPLSNASDCSLG